MVSRFATGQDGRVKRVSFRGGRRLGWFVAPLLIASTATASAASSRGPVAARAHAVGNGVIESSWVQVREGVQRPTQRFALSYAGYDGVLAYDAKREQSVLFVHAENEIYHPYAPSQTWLFDGAARRWSQSPASTPPLFGGQVAFDAREGVVVLIGSPADGGTCLDSMPAQTWTWNGTSWTRLHPKTSPGQCSALDASMAYDDTTHRIIMATTDYGGAKVTVQNTWVWDGTNWTHRGRGPLANATVAYDPVSRTCSHLAVSIGGSLIPGPRLSVTTTRHRRGTGNAGCSSQPVARTIRRHEPLRR